MMSCTVNDHMPHNAIVLFKAFNNTRHLGGRALRLAFSQMPHFGDARRLRRVLDILRQMLIGTNGK